MALDLDDPTTRDYLGAESPLALADKPALPSGGVPAAGATGPSFGGSGVGALGATTAPTRRPAPFGTVETGPSGATGVTGAAQDVTTTGGSRSGSKSNDPFAAALGAAFGLGEPIAEQVAKYLAPDGAPSTDLLERLGITLGGDPDASVLKSGSFSLGGDPNAPVLASDKFSLGGKPLDVSLPKALPSVAVGDGLDPSKFSLGGDESAGIDAGKFSLGAESGDALNPKDFTLGVPPLSDTAGGGFDFTHLASILPILGKLGPAFGGGSLNPDLNKALGVGASVAGESLSAFGPAANPVLAAWNLPSVIEGIANIIDPQVPGTGVSADVIRRQAKRQGAASDLQKGILNPVLNASSPDEFLAALETPVGGSTVGDALARIVSQNQSGGWASGDTGHQWLPDPALRPLLQFLNSAGYMGTTEPKEGDVGGVGEIVQGAGTALVPQDTQWIKAGGSADPSAANQRTPWMQKYDATYGDPRAFFVEPSEGALGYDALLRQMTAAITGDEAVPFQPLTPFPKTDATATEGGAVLNPVVAPEPYVMPAEDNRFTAANRVLSPEYIHELMPNPSSDSSALAEVNQGIQAKLDMLQNFAMYEGGGGS